MNSQIVGLRVAGTLFGLMCLGQLARLLMRPEILVAGHQMPLWPSAIALVILGVLSFWMWKLSSIPASEFLFLYGKERNRGCRFLLKTT